MFGFVGPMSLLVEEPLSFDVLNFPNLIMVGPLVLFHGRQPIDFLYFFPIYTQELLELFPASQLSRMLFFFFFLYQTNCCAY